MKYYSAVLLMFLLIGCSSTSSEHRVQTAIVQTQNAATTTALVAKPTITPKPTFDTRENDYLNTIEVYFDDYQDSRIAVRDFLQGGIAFMFSEQGQTTFKGLVNSITEATHDMRLVTAPESCSDLYNKVVELDKKTRAASDLTIKAFGSMSSDLLDQAIDIWEEINSLMISINTSISNGKCQ